MSWLPSLLWPVFIWFVSPQFFLVLLLPFFDKPHPKKESARRKKEVKDGRTVAVPSSFNKDRMTLDIRRLVLSGTCLLCFFLVIVALTGDVAHAAATPARRMLREETVEEKKDNKKEKDAEDLAAICFPEVQPVWEAVVDITSDFTFVPTTTFIFEGGNVTWRWQGSTSVPHNVAADDNSFRCSRGCHEEALPAQAMDSISLVESFGKASMGDPTSHPFTFTRTFRSASIVGYDPLSLSLSLCVCVCNNSFLSIVVYPGITLRCTRE